MAFSGVVRMSSLDIRPCDEPCVDHFREFANDGGAAERD